MILLAHSNFLARDSKQRARMKPYSPLSTLIAAALLRRNGHDVALFNSGAFDDIDAESRSRTSFGPTSFCSWKTISTF